MVSRVVVGVSGKYGATEVVRDSTRGVCEIRIDSLRVGTGVVIKIKSQESTRSYNGRK